MVQPLSLKASAFVPTTSVAGSEPATIFRGENVVIRGLDGISKFEVFPGCKDLNENYNIDIVPVRQVESGTVIAAAGITADGTALLAITLHGQGYGILVPLTVAAHTTAALIAAAFRTAIQNDSFLNGLFTVSGSGADVVITDRLYRQNDPTRNILMENYTCTGITNGPTSGDTTAGVAGFRLSGTLAFTAGSKVVTGTSTLFLTELHTGQCIQSGGEAFWVNIVNSDTSFIAERAPTTTQTGQIARCLPVLFEVDRKRGVQKQGNAIIQDRGDLIFVGDGELYLNGVATGFSATRQPARLQRETDGSYSRLDIGFRTVPTKPSITVVGGGTKGMVAGSYSFMISFWNSVTKGFSNPSVPLKLDASNNPIVLTAGQQVRFDFDDSLIGRPNNADGFVIWGSLSGGGVTQVNAANYAEGPWYRVRDVKFSELDGNNAINIEYLDAELGEVVSGDNNAPPDCEWVCDFANSVFFVSALGKRTALNDLGTSPGSYVVPTKPGNREAAPYRWRVNIGDEITGFALGAGRLFTQTAKGIPFVTPTGKTEIARLLPQNVDIPFTMRPFWTKGGISPYGIEVVQDSVFMMTGGQPLRSPSMSDLESRLPFELGQVMVDLFRDLPNGHFLVKHDPKNQQVCFIGSAMEKNTQGYWVSKIFPYDIQRNRWMPTILLSKTDRDMIVSGAAVVDDRLEFLAGGRVAGGTHQVRTYRYDEPAGEAIPYYFVFQPSDMGEEEYAKIIKWLAVTGRVHNFKIQIHGTNEDGDFSITDIANGVNSISGDVTFADTSALRRFRKRKHLVKNLQLWSLRASGVWPGTGEVDRIDEILAGIGTHGYKG